MFKKRLALEVPKLTYSMLLGPAAGVFFMLTEQIT